MKTLAIATVLFSAVAPVMAATTELSYYNSDTRTNSASTPDAFASPGDANPGSLMYSTGGAGGGNKVAVTFYKPGSTAGTNGAPSYDALGTLGTLNQLSFDYYINSANVSSATLAPAVRLKLSPLGTSDATYVDLVWENTYNATGPNSVKDAWQNDVELSGAKFWQRSGINMDTYSNFQTLPTWAGGFQPTNAYVGGTVYPTSVVLNANTPIYGIEVSLGSGLPNNFTAYIDDVNVGFSTGDSFASNVPEPTSLAVLGLGSAALLLRRRRQAAR